MNVRSNPLETKKQRGDVLVIQAGSLCALQRAVGKFLTILCVIVQMGCGSSAPDVSPVSHGVSGGATAATSKIEGQVRVLGEDSWDMTQFTATLSIGNESLHKVSVGDTGKFEFLLPTTAEELLAKVSVQARGFLPQHQAVNIPVGPVQIPIAVMPRRLAPGVAFSLDEQSHISHKTGHGVALPAQAFMLPNGELATGQAMAHITPMDVRNKSNPLLVSFPNFIGLPAGEGASPVALYSYGMADFEFYQGDQKLSLRPGMKAQITLPLSSARIATQDSPLPIVDASEGDELRLWHYDTEDMLWKEEGHVVLQSHGATESGFVGVGQVSHFSTWNMDAVTPAKDIRVVIRLVDFDGKPISLPGVEVNSYRVEARVPEEDGAGAWPGETSWINSVNMTAKHNQITVLSNDASRQSLIDTDPRITGWTRMQISVDHIVVEGLLVPDTFQKTLRFYDYKGPDEVMFELPYEYVR